MAKDKICPLMSVNGYTKKCKKEECAWWDPVEEKCAIALLGVESGARLREKDEGRPWR